MDIDNYVHLKDESNDRKYFSLLPHYILNHSTAIDQALYMQMKRYAGESPNGLCWASKATLRERLGIGKIALNKSLEYLLKRGWITYKGKKTVATKGGEQEVNVYAISDIWKQNIEYYETINKVGLKQHTLLKGGSETDSKGGLESSKGGSETAANKNHMNKNHRKKKIEDATTLKDNFLNNPLMEKIKLLYPDRDYDLEFNLMVDWWNSNKGALPQNISAFKNWLAYTKPNKQVNSRIIREKK